MSNAEFYLECRYTDYLKLSEKNFRFKMRGQENLHIAI